MSYLSTCVTLLSQISQSLQFLSQCHSHTHVTMTQCHTYVTISHSCHNVMSQCHTHATMSHSCHNVSLMSQFQTHVTMSHSCQNVHLCHNVTLMSQCTLVSQMIIKLFLSDYFSEDQTNEDNSDDILDLMQSDHQYHQHPRQALEYHPSSSMKPKLQQQQHSDQETSSCGVPSDTNVTHAPSVSGAASGICDPKLLGQSLDLVQK